MTITAAEVVHHAAPIAALLGVGELRYLNAVGCGCVMNDEWSLSPDQAAALILGLIVARSEFFKIDEDEHGEWVGVGKYATPDDAEFFVAPCLAAGCNDDDNVLATRFVGACTAFARAHGLSPAPTTEDTTNG